MSKSLRENDPSVLMRTAHSRRLNRHVKEPESRMPNRSSTSTTLAAGLTDMSKSLRGPATEVVYPLIFGRRSARGGRCTDLAPRSRWALRWPKALPGIDFHPARGSINGFFLLLYTLKRVKYNASNY